MKPSNNLENKTPQGFPQVLRTWGGGSSKFDWGTYVNTWGEHKGEGA